MVHTSNKFGTSIIQTDPYIEHFLNIAASANNLLEIGAGHGFASSRILESTQASLTINDLDLSQLDALGTLLTETQKSRVTFLQGRFPDAFSEISDSTYDAILLARVLHFIQPEEFQTAIVELRRILKPGGKVVVTALSPENSHFLGFYKSYLYNLAFGNPWPGSYVNAQFYRPNAPLPKYLHLLDPHVLIREFLATGFKVEKAGYIDRAGQYSSDILLGKREGVGIIAIKPN
jgi:ubiquinone/menaquinone biosynthesis C-methylase UbiE